MVRMEPLENYGSSSTTSVLAKTSIASAIVSGIRSKDFYTDPLPVEDDLDLTNFECIPYLVASYNGKTIRTQRAKVNLVVSYNSETKVTTMSEYPLRDIVSVTKTSTSTFMYVRMYNSIEIDSGVETSPGVDLEWHLDIHLRRIA